MSSCGLLQPLTESQQRPPGPQQSPYFHGHPGPSVLLVPACRAGHSSSGPLTGSRPCLSSGPSPVPRAPVGWLLVLLGHSFGELGVPIPSPRRSEVYPTVPHARHPRCPHPRSGRQGPAGSGPGRALSTRQLVLGAPETGLLLSPRKPAPPTAFPDSRCHWSHLVSAFCPVHTSPVSKCRQPPPRYVQKDSRSGEETSPDWSRWRSHSSVVSLLGGH